MCRIEEVKDQISHTKGQYIFRQGDPIEGLYFIQSGYVKVVSTGWQGREQIVRFADREHLLGHCAIEGETYPISAITMTTAVICFIDNALVNEIITGNTDFIRAIANFYSRELRKTQLRLKYAGQMNVREKIATFLLQMSYEFNRNGTELNLQLSRQDIADLTGTSADQVIKHLSDFEQEKLITKEKKKIHLIDVGKIQKIVAEFNIDDFFQQH